jgi:hypothetical protein
MIGFDDWGGVIAGNTGALSSLLAAEIRHCQVVLQVERVGSQKNPFLAQKVFYGGCMTGRFQTATKPDKLSDAGNGEENRNRAAV